METTNKINSGKEIFNELIRQAWNNPEFKENLIKYPKTSIENFAGKKMDSLLKGRNLIVEDQTDENTIYLNIPSIPNLDDLELDKEELEKVTGGSTWPCGIGIAVGVAQIAEWLGDGWNNYK